MAMSGDRAANVERAVALAREAAAGGADLVVLPELFSGRYFPQSAEEPAFMAWAEPIPGPLTERLGGLAAELGVSIVGSIYEQARTGLRYNTAVLLGADGSLVGRSRKAHIPDGPGYAEKYYFAPGDSDYPVFPLTPRSARQTTLGLPTCWDQWFPEVARLLALKGAELIAYPTAIGSEPDPAFAAIDTHDAWRTVMRGHAIANACFVMAVNRCGHEDGIDFYGGSFVSDPLGEVIAELGREEGILRAELDFERLRLARDLGPFFRDRRPETYGGLLSADLATPVRPPP